MDFYHLLNRNTSKQTECYQNLLPLLELERERLPIWLLMIVYFILMKFLFVGLITISEILMTSIEKITNKRHKNLAQELGSNCKRWNKTIADCTLRAIGLNLPVIVYPSIELIQAKFQSHEQIGHFIIFVSCFI
jgi:hypothetical protein